jgi:hypothetical protein
MRGLRIFIVCALFVATVAGLPLQSAVAQEAQAELAIQQPAYVSGEVETTTEGGDRIYQASGSPLLLRFQNADHDAVTSVSVRNGPGAISYDAELDLYRFRSDGQTGSSELVFIVEENGSTQEYTAVLQVDQIAWAHRPSDEDEQLQAAADKWRDVEQEAQQINPEEDPEEIVSTGLTIARFVESPFSSILQNMRNIFILMLFTPGGWVIFGTFLFISLAGVATGARYKNRTQKQLADVGDIKAEKDEAFLEKVRSRVLQQNDWNQLFPDDIARANRDIFGRNVWQGCRQFSLLWSPRSVKATVLQMMGQTGYAGYVVRDADGSVQEASVEQVGGDPDDHKPAIAPDTDIEGISVESVDLTALDFSTDADVIDAIHWSDLDDSVFQLDREQIDIDTVSLPISNRDIDDAEFLETVNPAFPDDFEDEEEFARVCGEVMEFVIEHPHTDELGRSREKLDLVSYLSEMSSVLADDGGFPVGHYQRKTFFWVAENLSTEDEVSETVDRINRDSVGGGEPT